MHCVCAGYCVCGGCVTALLHPATYELLQMQPRQHTIPLYHLPYNLLTTISPTPQTPHPCHPPQVEASTRSTNRSFQKLITQDGIDPKLIYDTICKQTVELTFTAHPTQALRMSLLKKYSNVRYEVQRLHGSRMSPYEKLESLDAIRSHVQVCGGGGWGDGGCVEGMCACVCVCGVCVCMECVCWWVCVWNREVGRARGHTVHALPLSFVLPGFLFYTTHPLHPHPHPH